MQDIEVSVLKIKAGNEIEYSYPVDAFGKYLGEFDIEEYDEKRFVVFYGWNDLSGEPEDGWHIPGTVDWVRHGAPMAKRLTTIANSKRGKAALSCLAH